MSISSNTKISHKQKKRFLELVQNFKKSKILVVGDFILDQFIWGNVERISPEAPVPVVHVQRNSYMPGGALNVANNILHMRSQVYPCGVVGRDLEGRMLLKTMRREKIDTGGIIYDAQRPTALKTRIIAHSQQVVRFDREKAGDISAEDQAQILKFIKEKIKDVHAVIIEDYGKGVVLPALVRTIVKFARTYRKPILVDPKEKHFDYYKQATILTPNRREAEIGFESLYRRKAKSLDELGKGLVKKMQSDALLVTLGEQGMALFEKKGGVTQIPTAARQVYDVSGAGDTVIAVLAMALASGASFLEGAIISNLAAGIVVGKLGTAVVLPEELEQAISAAAS